MEKNKYGYQVDISEPRNQELYYRYKKWKGIPRWCPLSDEERFEFEDYVLGRKRGALANEHPGNNQSA